MYVCVIDWLIIINGGFFMRPIYSYVLIDIGTERPSSIFDRFYSRKQNNKKSIWQLQPQWLYRHKNQEHYGTCCFFDLIQCTYLCLIFVRIPPVTSLAKIWYKTHHVHMLYDYGNGCLCSPCHQSLKLNYPSSQPAMSAHQTAFQWLEFLIKIVCSAFTHANCKTTYRPCK